MKQQKVPKERNVFVSAAMFRKAGAHTKTTKAKRTADKVKFLQNIRTGNQNEDQSEVVCI